MNPSFTAPDLTQRPPRSHRIKLGGYVMLPRILDKARALIANKIGEYRYGAKSMDRHFFNFTGVNPDALQTELATGKGDGEILAWIEANSKFTRAPWEVAAWSEYHLNRLPDSDAETMAVGKFTKTREDIHTWFDLLDLDDHCTFGGKA
jgi:hypothetical protein